MWLTENLFMGQYCYNRYVTVPLILMKVYREFLQSWYVSVVFIMLYFQTKST